jgi:hypothetical protein
VVGGAVVVVGAAADVGGGTGSVDEVTARALTALRPSE